MQSAAQAVSAGEPHTEESTAGAWRVPFPFTLRGTLIVALTVYLLAGPARADADIVAATTGYSLAALLIILLIGTVLQGVALRRKVLLEINHGAAVERFESGRSTTIVLKLPRISIFPGFLLSIRPRFASPLIELPEFRLTGSADASRYLTYQVTFPHRGIWKIQQVAVQFGDQLGLTQLRWDLFGESIQRRFMVHPPMESGMTLPVISSCERPGDLLTHTHERHGDPFDIRQYHPSDGARRILWKVFARSGELVSRHPEASMTPEGQVVLFSPALREEDHVCTAMIQYAKQLRELDLELFCGCTGMEIETPARTPEQVETLLIDSVWDADVPLRQSIGYLSGFIETVAEKLSSERLKRVAFFTSPERFRQREDLDLILEMGESLERRGIEPVFFVVTRGGMSAEISLARLRAAQSRGIFGMVGEWFTMPEESESPISESSYRNFLAACARKSWEISINGAS